MNRATALLGLLAGACRAAPIPDSARYPAGTPFAARYVTIGTTRIRYIDAGTGTPVVFIHGLASSMYEWRKNLPAVLDAGFRVVAFDNRGFGGSDKPASGYSNGDYERLVVALLDSLRLADAVLVGHSMGGQCAAEVALAESARVRGLVLIAATVPGTWEPPLYRVGRWPLVGRWVLALRSRGFTERILRSTYADPSTLSQQDVDQYYAPVAAPEYGRALAGVLREFRFDALEGRVGLIEAPTLVIWGEADRWVPLALGWRLASELSRGAFRSVRRAGHAVQEEAADEVNRLLIAYLQQGLPRIPADLAERGGAIAAGSAGR